MDGEAPPDTPQHGLFRTEAVVAARSRMGSPVRPAGVASWVICVFLVSLFLAVGIFLTTARYARTETVEGELEPTSGALRVAAVKPGVIGDVFVSEGAYVAAGAPIASVIFDPVLEGGAPLGRLLRDAADVQDASLTAQTQAHETSLERQRGALAAKRDGLLAQVRRLRHEADLQRQRVSLEQQTLDSIETLHQKQFISEFRYRQQQESLLSAQQSLSEVEKQQDDATAALGELDQEELRLRADLAEARAAARSAYASIQEKRANLSASSRVILTVPRAGRVAALQAKPGASIAAGAALAVIMPANARLEAHLWIPSRAAGFLRTGDPVRLMYDAFPYERFGVGHGRVVAMSKAPVPQTELPATLEAHEPLYRVVTVIDRQEIAAYGQKWSLAPGMRLRAKVILESRSFIQWIFDPLLAAGRQGL